MSLRHPLPIATAKPVLDEPRLAAPQPLDMRLRQLTDSWLGAMLGALVYGSWAVFVNWSAGYLQALRIGAAHWLMSTLLTYYGTTIMRAFYGLGRSSSEGAALAFACGMGFTYTVLISIHHMIGTPHIALTLAAGAVPTLMFCSGYALLLSRTARAAGARA